jgi:hypothetical protein
MPVAWLDHLGVAHAGVVYALLAPGTHPLDVAPPGTDATQFPSGLGHHHAPRVMVAIPGRRRQVHYRTPVVTHLLRHRLPAPAPHLPQPDDIIPVGTPVCWRNNRVKTILHGTVLAHCPAGEPAVPHLPSGVPLRQFRGSLVTSTDRYLVRGPGGLFFAPLASHVRRLHNHAA